MTEILFDDSQRILFTVWALSSKNQTKSIKINLLKICFLFLVKEGDADVYGKMLHITS